MPTIRFVQHTGDVHDVTVASGTSLMDAAVGNLIPGILGDCGGNCSCATCHAYIEQPWKDKLAGPSEDELDLLEGALDTTSDSRLACQVRVDDTLDGMVVRLPARQY